MSLCALLPNGNLTNLSDNEVVSNRPLGRKGGTLKTMKIPSFEAEKWSYL